MPDTLEVTDPQVEIDAVAELCHDVGVSVGMNYCSSDNSCLSSAHTYHMAPVYQLLYGYGSWCDVVYRPCCDWPDWFDYIIAEVSANRPIQYRVLGHSIVCDGYRWTANPEYHMNYGWANNNNAWYVLENLHQPSPDGTVEDEYMVLGISPNCALGAVFSGVLPRPAVDPYYRYIDTDCIGFSATFEAGQYIQFLPRMRVTCASGSVRFLSSALESRLISYDVTKGIKLINNGELRINEGGTVRIDAPARP